MRRRHAFTKRKKRVPFQGNPNKKETHHRASRVAPFLLPTIRKNARRSILIVPDTLVDATTPALARFYRRVRSTARRSRHLSPPTHTSFWWSSLHPERERERESPKHRDGNEKKEATRQLATFARRHNHLLSRVRTKTDEKTTRELLENARLTERGERERRERVYARTFLPLPGQNVRNSFPPQKNKKKLQTTTKKKGLSKV